MARSIKLTSDGENLIVSVDEKTSKVLPSSSDIKASDIYESLDYSRNDVYELSKGDHGDIAEPVFEGFYSLMDEIISEVNKLARENMPSDNASSAES